MLRNTFPLILSMLSLGALAQPPQQFELVYRFHFNGQPVGLVTDRFERQNGRYTLTSEARPEARLAWLLPGLTLNSEGYCANDRLAPKHFRQIRAGSPDKTAEAQFDWDAATLTHRYKGKTEALALPAGTQDSLSQIYFFAVSEQLPASFDLPVTNGRKLITYRYERLPAAPVETPFGTFPAIEYRRIAEPGENAISVWIAPDLHHLPLRIRVQETAGVFEKLLAQASFSKKQP